LGRPVGRTALFPPGLLAGGLVCPIGFCLYEPYEDFASDGYVEAQSSGEALEQLHPASHDRLFEEGDSAHQRPLLEADRERHLPVVGQPRPLRLCPALYLPDEGNAGPQHVRQPNFWLAHHTIEFIGKEIRWKQVLDFGAFEPDGSGSG
jgi:hypothetical protein